MSEWKDDPTIERVRAARREIAAEAGDDVHALFEWARSREAAHPERVVGYETDRKGTRA
jgi:N-acetyl-anhydromuramyl-L-alanine amidase AmpD